MTTVTQLDTAQIFPGTNDRTRFDANALAELAANIAAHGLIQPITVRAIEGTDLAADQRIERARLRRVERTCCRECCGG